MTLTLAESLPELEAQLEDAESRATALRKIVEGIRALNGHATHVAVRVPRETAVPGASEDAKPRGRGAVRLIVAERPGIWSLAELREEMQARGWFTSPKGLEVAVTRLCVKGEARRVGKGRYEFPANDGKEGVIESPTSGVA